MCCTVKSYVTKMSIAVMNAILRSAIPEHLVKKSRCAELYVNYKFKILRQCLNVLNWKQY